MAIAKITLSVPSKVPASSEAALKNIYDALETAHTAVSGVLATVEKMDPLAPVSTTALTAQKKISKIRPIVLKDLAKSAKRGELHSNPSKLKAMIKSLNEDIAATNALEGGVAGHLATYFQGQLDDIEDEITRSLPRGVHPSSLGLSGTLAKFKRIQTKKGYANFSAGRRALISQCRAEGEEQDRINKIKALGNDAEILKIKIKVRDAILEAGKKDTKATAKSIKILLEAAFEKQDKPDKKRWASYLELGADGSYRTNEGGKYNGTTIHWTMSSDSWTPNADGNVSISANSVDAILTGILKSTDWKQLHATLEVGRNKSKWPHVFQFAGVLSNDTKWPEAKTILGVDDAWITSAQAQMKTLMKKVTADLKKKIKLAKDRHGANV